MTLKVKLSSVLSYSVCVALTLTNSSAHYFLQKSLRTQVLLIKQMTDHYQPKPSTIVQRFKFHSCSRKPGESVATYIAELKRLSEDCEFGDFLQEMLRDRIVCGINDPRI